MPESLAFHEPTSVADAVGLLARYGGEAKVVAGSTAVTIMLRNRLIAPRALVSLGRIQDGLRSIREEDGALVLGALVTHREVEMSALVRERIPVLAETFGTVANVRVRNVATVGGVVAEADYASDPPAVLLALDAQIEARGPSGERRIPVADFFRGFYETALEADEVVTAVRIPIPPAGTRGSYEKFVTRSSEDRPCVGVVALARFDGQRCADLRVAVGAASETPRRHPEIEQLGRGTTLRGDVVPTIAAGYASAIDALDDMRGSSWYRRRVIEVWVRRAIERVASAASQR
ncbi:MAG TPA: xanthine dehydrogenase family protein subunit M [Candidatus Limnocylindria bacterium]|jgi:carbon-monoxide dehydrogenase medium subunit|nr:xanthine dehydrogenase family protein subunit M [Candidatus Limnocylindria bacterium]